MAGVALPGTRRCTCNWWQWLLTGLLVFWLASWARADQPQVLREQLQRGPDALYLSVRLDLAPSRVVEDVLVRGVPLYFVWQADVYRQRWYWTDKRVAGAQRTLRLAYQPLTRRWRLSLANGVTGSGSGASLQYALHQNFDSLADAMAVVGRVTRWRVADQDNLEADARLRVEWRMQLDLSLLPRPFQIGVANQPAWDISVARRLRVPDMQEESGGGETGVFTPGLQGDRTDADGLTELEQGEVEASQSPR